MPSAATETSPGSRYQRTIKSATRENPRTPAWIPFVFASSPNDAPIVWLPKSSIGTGSAPEFRRPTSCFASSGVNVPVISAFPPRISSCITGSEIGAPSRYMARIFPVCSRVMRAKSASPSSLNSRFTRGAPEMLSKPRIAFLRNRPVSSVGTKSASVSGMFSGMAPLPVRSASSNARSSFRTFSFSGLSGRSMRNSRSGVCPIIAIARLTSVTPGNSTMRRFSLFSEITPAVVSTWTTGSATPKRFTRRSMTSRSASIDSRTSPA